MAHCTQSNILPKSTKQELSCQQTEPKCQSAVRAVRPISGQ